MGCRLTSNIKNICDFDSGGIKQIHLLPSDALVNIIYKDDALADIGQVEDIIISEDFTILDTTEKSIYNQTENKGVYTHQITTYIRVPDGNKTSLLTIAAKGKYVVVFETYNDKFFLFGSDFGASLSYTISSGTFGDGSTYTITISTLSRLPLLESIDFTTHKQEAIPPVLPDWAKQPIKEYYLRVDPVYDIISDKRSFIQNSIASDNWDASISAVTLKGGLTQGTYKTRVIGEYEWMIENFKLRYMDVDLGNGYPLWYRLTDEILLLSNYKGNTIQYIKENGALMYAGSLSDDYLNLVSFYDLPENYNFGISENLFSSKYITDYKVENGKLVHDSNYISWFLPPGYGQGNYTISRSGTTSTIQAYQVWGDLSIANPQVGTSTTNSLTAETGSYGTGVLFVISSNGTKLSDLPKIKVELGTTSTTWIEPLYNYKANNWDIPKVEDFAQLFGMVGEDLSVENLIKNLFVSSDDDWIDQSWVLKDKSNNTIGSRLLPCGQKQNTDGGSLYGFGERMGFGTKRPLGDQSAGMPLIYFNTQDIGVYGLVLDNATSSESIKFWQHNYRFCRRLSDQELGYRLWVDEVNDKILVTELSDPQPDNTTELEKGLLRGLAVRWMNENKTEVLSSLSKLREEVNKTKDNGGYNWVGWN